MMLTQRLVSPYSPPEQPILRSLENFVLAHYLSFSLAETCASMQEATASGFYLNRNCIFVQSQTNSIG
jgi:hypothetical protein